MPKFIFAYHGGKKPESPEEGEKVMGQWMAWFADLGDAVIDGGNPVGQSFTVHSGGVDDNGGANPISGYSLVQAPDMVTATGYAKNCPMVQDGSGSVEVAETFDM